MGKYNSNNSGISEENIQAEAEPLYRPMPGYERIKRLLDMLFSLVLIVLLSPLLLILAAVVLLDDGTPILYKAPRVGRSGKPIYVYKFRTMKRSADNLAVTLTPEQLAEYRKKFKLDNDPRVTRTGRILRKTSLDELPQLFNILGGSMSFVGPRPVLEEETQLYGTHREDLLSVRPGLTGLWQAKGRSNVTYEDGARQKLELEYVKTRSLKLDFQIIGWTFGAVLRMDGAK